MDPAEKAPPKGHRRPNGNRQQGRQEGHRFGEKGMAAQGGDIGEHKGPRRNGQHTGVFQVGGASLCGQRLPQDAPSPGCYQKIEGGKGEAPPQAGQPQPEKHDAADQKGPHRPLVPWAEQRPGKGLKGQLHTAAPPGDLGHAGLPPPGSAGSARGPAGGPGLPSR